MRLKLNLSFRDQFQSLELTRISLFCSYLVSTNKNPENMATQFKLVQKLSDQALSQIRSIKECWFFLSLKWNERHRLHHLRVWKHTKHCSKKRRHIESYWNSQRNSQRNCHRQERIFLVSAFLPHTCKDRSLL